MTDGQSRQLGYALDSQYYEIDGFTDYVRAELDELTLADVNRVIRENLRTDDMEFVFVTRDAEDLKSRLVSGAESLVSYDADKPVALLEEDREIASVNLGIAEDRVRVVPADAVFRLTLSAPRHVPPCETGAMTGVSLIDVCKSFDSVLGRGLSVPYPCWLSATNRFYRACTVSLCRLLIDNQRSFCELFAHVFSLLSTTATNQGLHTVSTTHLQVRLGGGLHSQGLCTGRSGRFPPGNRPFLILGDSFPLQLC